MVLHKTVSDIITLMELQRPGATPTLPQWDLGIVLEAPLREPSFRHFTLKTVFLLTMFSVGRRSELHALRFDQNCIQFKPNGAGVTPYFSPEFMRKSHAEFSPGLVCESSSLSSPGASRSRARPTNCGSV